MNPPLRSAEHRDALRAALADGTIDAVATDHAPHALEEKEREFDQAPPGTIGLETALAVVLTELVAPGRCRCSTPSTRCRPRPRASSGSADHGGPGRAGRAGEPGRCSTRTRSGPWASGPFHSMAGNSAFLGRTLRGRVLHTMLRGDFTVRDGEPRGDR